MASEDLQELPAPHDQLARYIADHPDIPMTQIMEPYRKYEAQLRSIFAQDRKNALLEDPHVNVLPLFTKDTKDIKIRARDLASESQEEKDRYIMALPEEKRRAHGSPAVVGSLADFRRNFSIFSESSLADLDWSNIVAAGSSVVNTLLPVPQEFNGTKRKLREYYHEKFCPASDVDLFLYGLTHEEAVEKIKQVEKAIRDAILTEVTVVRTKYAITIASQYPTRHVQIVLRVYKSIGEILTGFDIDAAGGAYDGSQVWVTPRALGSFITQINHIDLSRRSPSYENRLSKYSHRNFEVYWPELDRNRVDPTIFERSFQRTLGLARLLVLERLPTSSVRDTYLNKRREERGRPAVNRFRQRLFGNIKDMHEDEVADWVDEQEVSNYHTFTVPYGQRFHAKKIEKLCYTRDLLLNAEWNQPKEREVYLHRHPAFFGRVEDVIEDCCGFCPPAVTPEEIEVAEKEKEIYISGKVHFLIDDPGRQQIGSFNPLTEDDWTDMAYVGNTARLCQSIVDCNLDEVNDWLSQEDADPNKRDYTGRTPLQLAVISSTPEIVKSLIEHGARLTARLADGMTALHLAAERGDVEMIKLLMEKSIENEAEEEEKEDRRRKAAREAAKDSDSAAEKDEETDEDDEGEDSDEEESDGELIDGEETDVDVHSIATGSFVKVKKGEEESQDAAELDGSKDEPDFFKSDVLAWDIPCSPLHLAIAQGHEDVVTELCNYGSDSLLPVKFLNSEKQPTGAILTLALALVLPLEKAKSMAKLLLKLGATSSQADLHGCTALHRYIQNGTEEMVDLLWTEDKSGVKTAINHLVSPENNYYNAKAVGPLHTAIDKGDITLVLRLLEAGAKTEIDFDSWLKATKFSSRSNRLGDFEANKKLFGKSVEQPLIYAARDCVDPAVALEILERGADPNVITAKSSEILNDEWSRRYNKGESVLDVVQNQIKRLRKFKGERSNTSRKTTQLPKNMHEVLSSLPEGTYQHYFTKKDIENKERLYKKEKESQEETAAQVQTLSLEDKKAAIDEAIAGLKQLEEALIAAGAKGFYELHPTVKKPERYYDDSSDDSAEEQAKEEATPPYKVNIIFRGTNDVTETRKEAYIKLFEAAFAGDLATINSLALSPWGNDNEEPPLKIAVSDSDSNNPFSLAFLRGHYDVAKAILEIVKVQYSPTEKDDERYKLDTGHNDDDDYDDDDSYHSEDDASDDSEPKIVSEKINKKFTIDNIGQVSMQVKSHTRPLDFMLWASPPLQPPSEDDYGRVYTLFRYTMKQDDQAAFNRLMDWAVSYAGQKLQGDKDDHENYFIFPELEFKYAVDNGKISFLGEIIKRTGAGMPLDTLVKKSGVEIKEKPKTYQGLTVYGKKRKDWATAGRNLVVKATGLKTPPLLHAAFAGNIESVEWFLGDTPHRYYVEFGKSDASANDPRLKHLNQTAGVFDRAVSNWLGIQNELIIHCAVLGKPGKKAEKLLEYLVEACPASLEYKCKTGDTPLQLAFWAGRLGFAKILLAAGANQSVRNAQGSNLIHSLVMKNPKADKLKPMLELIDAGLRSHLLVQRNNLHEEGVTPLHAWVKAYCDTQDERERTPVQPPSSKLYKYCCYKDKEQALPVLHLLLEYSQGAELEMLNGAGDTPLHTATMQHNLDLIEALLTYRPQLLYRENAVGRTPIEVARSRVLARKFETPPAVTQTSWYSNNCMAQNLVDRKPEDYSRDKKLVEEKGINPWPRRAQEERYRGYNGERNQKHAYKMEKALEIMEEYLVKHPGERRLVSLGEANDVARRLSEKYNATRYFSIQPRPDDDEEKDEDEDEKKDQLDFVGTLRTQNNLHQPWHPKIEIVNGEEVEEY